MDSTTKIILFDSTLTILDLNELIKNDIFIIITFDYESHKLLLQNNITHIISDNYLNPDDLNIIQRQSYVFAKWFNEKKFSDFISYKGVNLGQLFHVEFHYMLVPFLKTFCELLRIFEKHKNSKYIGSSKLHEIMKCFTPDVSLIESHKLKETFLYDTVKLDVKIGKTSFSIKISRNLYFKLKHFSEKIIKKIIGKKKYQKDCITTLLVEFDTIKYQKILSSTSNIPINLVLYNRRRPTVWNHESYSIIKKSNCIVEDNDSLSDEMLKHSIINGLTKNKENITRLLNEINHLESFFSIDNISFWKILEKNFTQLIEKRSKEAIYEIEMTLRLFNKYRFNSVLVWSESGFNEQIIITLAKKFQIPIVWIQHGLGYDTPEIPYDYREICGVACQTSEKYIVWGKTSQKYFQKSGVPDNEIEVLGSPISDILFEKKIQPSMSGSYFLLATSSPVKNLVSDLTVNTLENYEMTIKRICEIVSKMNKNLIIKLHPFQEELDVTEFININPNVRIIKGGDIIPLIESCHALIVIDISTTILEAQILKKPVIVTPVKNYGWGNPELFNSKSCLNIKVDDLENSLNRILTDDEFKQNLIKNGTNFINEYLSNQGKSSISIMKFLQNFNVV